MKPSVRRARTDDGHLAPGWVLTRPAYGFTPTSSTVSRHPTWRAAHAELHTAPGSAGPQIERNPWTRR